MGAFVEICFCVWQPVFNRIFFQLLTVNCDYRAEQTGPKKNTREAELCLTFSHVFYIEQFYQFEIKVYGKIMENIFYEQYFLCIITYNAMYIFKHILNYF